MIRIIIIFTVVCLLPTGSGAQNFDAARAGLYANYDIRARNIMESQSAAISTMAFHHYWVTDKEKDIANLQREFDKYLVNLHNEIAIAAQLYGSYYEFTQMTNNLRNLYDVCSNSPENVIANAFNSEKRQIVSNIVTSTTELMYDIKKSIIDLTRMTEKERIDNLDAIRRKMNTINKQLRKLERNIRYYNLCDLWNDVRNREYNFRKKTNKEIAIEARDRWQEHYKPIFSNPR